LIQKEKKRKKKNEGREILTAILPNTTPTVRINKMR